MRKILLLFSTLFILVLSGCGNEVGELRKHVSTINTEVKRTVSLYEESMKTAESVNSSIEVLFDTQSLLPLEDNLSSDINPYLENLYSFYNTYVEEMDSFDFMYEGKALEENAEDLSIQVEDLSSYTVTRYFYDDKSNMLEQMYITTLPNGSTFMISLEWYKGELVKHEEMVSY